MSYPTNGGQNCVQMDGFYKLEQATRLYIGEVYRKLLELHPGSKPYNSYWRLVLALHCLGVGHFEYNSKARTSPELLIAERVHQQYQDEKEFITYDESEFDLSLLNKAAKRRHWGLYDLKVIAAKWMAGKNEKLLLKPGEAFLKILNENFHELKARQATRQRSYPTGGKYRAHHEAREQDGGSPRQRDKVEGAKKGAPPINSETQPVTERATAYMNETLRLMESVKRAQGAVARRTSKLEAHLLKTAPKKEASIIPPHMRIEEAKRIEYPWRK